MSTVPPKLLTGTPHEYPILVLLQAREARALEDGERELLRFVLPPWQRPEVWGEDRKRRYVEGIFLGLGTGYYVVHGAEWNGPQALRMSDWLIDGQQRMTALRDFVSGELSIFDGLRYDDLDVVTRRKRFEMVVFPSIELPYTSNEQLLRELYERLNFGGVPHNEEDLERVRVSQRPR
jgi:uncharacterized protein with ParB-like and HNH nuclease domain